MNRKWTLPTISNISLQRAGIKQMSEFEADGSSLSSADSFDAKKPATSLKKFNTGGSQQLMSTSSSSSSLSKHQVVRQMSSTASSELKASSAQEVKDLQAHVSEFKSNVSEMKSNVSEMKTNRTQSSQVDRNYSRSVEVSNNVSTKSSSSSTLSGVSSKVFRTSLNKMNLENTKDSSEDVDVDIVSEVSGDGEGMEDGEVEGRVTEPDSPTIADQLSLTSPNLVSSMASTGKDSMTFEQKRTTSSSKTKIMTDKFSSEQATASSSEMKKMQSGDVKYEASSQAQASKAKLQMDGLTAEKAAALKKEQKSLQTGDGIQQESTSSAAAGVKLQTDTFSAEKMATSSQQQKQTLTSTGVFNQEKHASSSASSRLTIKTKAIGTKTQAMLKGNISPALEDLDKLCTESHPGEVEKAMMKYSGLMSSCVDNLKSTSPDDAPQLLNNINQMMKKAWAVPTHGHGLGSSLCNVLRNNGGLDILIENCSSANSSLKFSSASLLEQVLTSENRAYVVDNGLKKVVTVACDVRGSVEHARVGTGILQHLFKYNEGTCSNVVKLGGLDAILQGCRGSDIETLQHCAGALANLSLYGGAENQEAMIKRQVHVWLFPLALNQNDNIRYYACLAISVLVANKEIEAAVLKSGSLDLVEPFVTSHQPAEFASSCVAHAHGQSKSWLQKLVPVLNSKRDEARNLAAFHFCMEAGIKRRQNQTEMLREIGAVEPLKRVASSPNAVASKYAAEALRQIGEEVPHKLSQQMPLWTVDDVREWVRHIGFPSLCDEFASSQVDGDLLLQMDEDMLRNDIGLENSILRKRFLRELKKMKLVTDYSSCDPTNLNGYLQSFAPEFSVYTYKMLLNGVTRDNLIELSEEQLRVEAGICNTIHLRQIYNGARGLKNETEMVNDIEDKNLDAFISYRRSNGSQLASLLKVHLQLRGFTVFIDVERLEAGKFDNNLLQSIKQARNFLLVLTPNALDRCKDDVERKDWVHKEIVEALNSQCNIIPIMDNFSWPDQDDLPEDMRPVLSFNAVRWIHDYQDACVEKLERFMRGESSARLDGLPLSSRFGDGTPGTPSSVVSRPPTFQRMHSNESAKGSSCSERESNGNTGGKE